MAPPRIDNDGEDVAASPLPSVSFKEKLIEYGPSSCRSINSAGQISFDVPLHEWSDFQIDSTLQDGRLSQVYKARLVEPQDDDEATNPRGRSVTLKCLKKGGHSKRDFATRAKALAQEASILSDLSTNHPNILQVQGASMAFESNSLSSHFFIMMDHMETTLEELLQVWKKRPHTEPTGKNQRRSLFSRICLGGGKAMPSSSMIQFHSRIQGVAVGVSSALKHIHSQGIVLNNLSPASIGLDARGHIKLFDFSQAGLRGRPLQQSQIRQTCSYTAPEILMGLESTHSFPADVYSFGIVLWQVATLRTPPPVTKTVMRKNKKKTDIKPPPAWIVVFKSTRRLIRDCCNFNPHARPSFVRVWVELLELYDAMDLDLEPLLRTPKPPAMITKRPTTPSPAPQSILSKPSSLRSSKDRGTDHGSDTTQQSDDCL